MPNATVRADATGLPEDTAVLAETGTGLAVVRPAGLKVLRPSFLSEEELGRLLTQIDELISAEQLWLTRSGEDRERGMVRVERGRFAPGYQGPGRGRGARDRLSRTVLEMLLEDFEAHGEEAIARCREDDPGAYLRVLTSIMPKDVKVTHAAEGMSVQEIEDEIRRIFAEAAARDAGDGRLIEGEAIEQDEA